MAAATPQHMGKTFHFCSSGRKEAFEKEPQKYMREGKMGGHHR